MVKNKLTNAGFLFFLSSLAITPAYAIEQGAIDQSPWVVHLNLVSGTGASGSCSGSQIDAHTVVTARHCLSHPGETATISGHSIDIESAHTLDGDAVVVHLKTPNPLPSYGALASKNPQVGSRGEVYGYGLTGEQLKRATVKIGQSADDAEGAKGFVLIPGDGRPTPGDSGGPITINGRIVGVVSGQDGSGNLVAASTMTP